MNDFEFAFVVNRFKYLEHDFEMVESNVYVCGGCGKRIHLYMIQLNIKEEFLHESTNLNIEFQMDETINRKCSSIILDNIL